MPEFRSLGDGSLRPPTAAELARQAWLREPGAEDVYIEPEAAPPAFWENLQQATLHVLTSDGSHWWAWEKDSLGEWLARVQVRLIGHVSPTGPRRHGGMGHR